MYAPFVRNLRERSRTGTHQNLTNAILECLHGLGFNLEVGRRCALLCALVLKAPSTLYMKTQRKMWRFGVQTQAPALVRVHGRIWAGVHTTNACARTSRLNY